MIAYSSQWLEALQVRRQAAIWHKKSLIGPEQYEAILAAYPVGFYMPNAFVRIGLAIFTWVLVSSAFGILGIALLADMPGETGIGVTLLFFGVFNMIGLEIVIREKHHYRSGIDDALLYLGLGFIVSGLALLLSSFDEPLPLVLVALPLLVIGAIRYLDRLVTICAFMCAVSILFLVLIKAGAAGRLVLPFLLMAFSGAGYAAVCRFKEQVSLRLLEECLEVLEGLCLLTFYLAGNYFVIRELSEVWFEQSHVPLAFVFYGFTALIPPLYIYFGLKNRDRLLLRTGMVLLAMAVFTFKYYFSLGHTEIMITGAGALLVTVAYVTIRFLKREHLPFTYAKDVTDSEEGPELETLVINETFAASVQGHAPIGENAFGGGQFGGGGSGGNY